MTKALILPLLRMKSGHHQVADAVALRLQAAVPEIVSENRELLSYAYGELETIVTKSYLQWIRWFPKLYSVMYHANAVRHCERQQRYKLYETIFEKALHRLVAESSPDLIICTHCLPSYLTSCLKRQSKLSVPVVNVYTDFLVNGLWGKHEIDLHLVPDGAIKELLLARGIPESSILVTGIPVHPALERETGHIHKDGSKAIVVMGGSLGVGPLERFLSATRPDAGVHYHVLCGSNEGLYRKLKAAEHSHITVYPYIHGKEEMNRLYELADLVITKPGGVTLSECLYKQKPVVLFGALPGQEEINAGHLSKQGLAVHWSRIPEQRVEEQVLELLGSPELECMRRRLANYRAEIKSSDIAGTLLRLLHR